MAEFDHAAFAQQNVQNFLSKQREPEEAKFAAPEALATAVGAGFILGPIGGLLLGAAQGILGKRMRQGQLDAIAEEQSAYDEVDAQFREALNSQTATSPEDVKQLNTLATQQAAARRMLASPIPQIQQQGAALQSQLFAAQRDYAIRQEEQAIAADVKNEAGKIAMGEQAWTRFNSVADDLTRESAPFMEQRTAYGKILASASSPSPAGDIALTISFMKVLDPGSVVREGEQAQASNAGGVDVRIRNIYNSLLTGERLSPEQRADFVSRAGAIYKSAVAEQDERNSRYIERARDGGVPEDYLDTLAIPTGAKQLPVPQASQSSGEFDEPDEPGVADHAMAAAGTVATLGMEGAQALDSIPGAAEALGIGGALSFKHWGPKLFNIAKRYGAPLAAVIAAGEQLPGESDDDYRHRLRRGMETTPYDPRPTN